VIRTRLKNLVRLTFNIGEARREAVRMHAFQQARRITPFVGVEHDGVRYILSTRERGVGFPTFVFGSFDEDTVNGMLTALEQHAGISSLEGLNVLEVGANIGTVAVSLLVRHGVERLVAVEPDAENVRILRANLALNGVQDRVEIHQIALSDTDDTLELESSTDNCGDHRIRVAAPSRPELQDEGQRATTEVSARSLDSLVASGEVDLDDIDLVWMDVQGHEAHMLAGARQLAARGTPVVTEYWPYGLRQAGALERFHALVAESYGIVIDLREPTVALDAKRVGELADRYTADGGNDPWPYTDLLLLPGDRSKTNAAVPVRTGVAGEPPRRRPWRRGPAARRRGTQKTGVSV
jgi:FkbM family methyltransferase